MTLVWQALFSDVPANVEPLSGREFIAAAAVQSEITLRVTVRQRRGLTPLDPTMRLVHGIKCCKFLGRQILNPHGALPDKDSGWEFVTLPCSLGADEG